MGGWGRRAGSRRNGVVRCGTRRRSSFPSRAVWRKPGMGRWESRSGSRCVWRSSRMPWWKSRSAARPIWREPRSGARRRSRRRMPRYKRRSSGPLVCALHSSFPQRDIGRPVGVICHGIDQSLQVFRLGHIILIAVTKLLPGDVVEVPNIGVQQGIGRVMPVVGILHDPKLIIGVGL